MAWDYKDQLKQVDLGGGGTAYYVYDASGERIRKVIVKTGGIIEQRVYLGGFEIFRKHISGSLDFERETLRISDDRKAIVDIETKTVESGSTISSPTSNIRYQYDNHLGSASLELDSSANIISYEEYHPFGTTSYRSGRTETEVSLKRYKYVGKERDEETGLYYYGARYYAGWICRFVSVDPLQHKYPYYTPFQYAGNKPISYIDLDGLEEASPELLMTPSIDPYMQKYHPEAVNTSFAKPLPSFLSSGRKPRSRYEQAGMGLLNTLAGLSIAVAGFSIAASTSVTVAGAIGGIAMGMAGLGQMAIGIAQLTDAFTNEENHVPPVSGLGEMIGYGISEKTGDPTYRAIGMGLDMGSSAGFGAAKTIPIYSNSKKIYSAIKNNNFKNIETYRNTIELYSELSTSFSVSEEMFNYSVNIPENDNGSNENFIVQVDITDKYHRIYPGETLSSISKQYNLKIDDLMKMNDIKNPDLIYAGDDIKILESRRTTVIKF
jgi:RHS repeat-associated protein